MKESSEAPVSAGQKMRIIVILHKDLPTWKKINVTSFLISGIATQEGATGEPYADASGNHYNAMITDPVMAYAATDEELRASYNKAMSRSVSLSVFTEDIFNTFNDIDNRAAVSDKIAEELPLVGIAFREKKNSADKIVKSLTLLS